MRILLLTGSALLLIFTIGVMYEGSILMEKKLWEKTSVKQELAEQRTFSSKTVALTFDDGPNPQYTEKLLDGLEERGVHVSFFLLGESLDKNENLVKRMAEAGHLIGVHGMHHADLAKEPFAKAMEDLREAAEKIEGIAGKKPEYIRPPYGSWSDELDDHVRLDLKLQPVFWTVDSLDWKLQDVGKIVQKVCEDVENGDVILMHDEFAESVEAAFRIIDNLHAKGYTFVTVDELVVD